MPAKVTVVAGSPPTITVTPSGPAPVTVTVCKQGPPGPLGPIGPAGSEPTITAAIDLGGHRVIAANSDGEGIYADQSNNTALAVQGISRAAAVTGDDCVVARAGALAYPAGGLTPDSHIWLGTNGLMTQTPPAAGWLRQVGYAIDADTISIDIGPAYWLGA